MFKSVTPSDLPRLNSHLETRAYLAGFIPSYDDHVMYSHVCSMSVSSEFAHVLRWAANMKSYSLDERASFPKKAKICDFAPASVSEAKPKSQSAGANLFDNDDESDDEETLAEKKALQARMEAKKKPKNAKVEMSMIILEIKPYSDESDIDFVSKNLSKKVIMEGLTWGEIELYNICYNLKGITVACAVVDELCSVDDLCEKVVETFSEIVQSCDVRSFNKLG